MTQGLDSAAEGQAAEVFDQVRRAAAAATSTAKRQPRGRRAAAGSAHVKGGAPSRAKARSRVSAIDDQYRRSAADLNRVILLPHPSVQTLQAAVRSAAAGYELRLAALRSIRWPPTVQPYVDGYLAVASTSGVELFERAKQAKTIQDLQTPADISTTFQLTLAEDRMLGALGLKPLS